MNKKRQTFSKVLAFMVAVILIIGMLIPSGGLNFAMEYSGSVNDTTINGISFNIALKQLAERNQQQYTDEASLAIDDRPIVYMSVDNAEMLENEEQIIEDIPTPELSEMTDEEALPNEEETVIIMDEQSSDVLIIQETDDSISNEEEINPTVADIPIITTETIDNAIQSIKWSDIAPSMDDDVVSVSENGKLVAWYEPADEALAEAQATGTDYFIVLDDNGQEVRVYKDFTNTIYLYFYAETPYDRIYLNQDMSYAFANMEALYDISSLRRLSADLLADTSYMFSGDVSLTDISPLASWNTVSLTNMSYMFRGCTYLSEVRNTLNTHEYDMVAEEQKTGYNEYLSQVLQYAPYINVETFATPYDPSITYEMLTDDAKAFYQMPYTAWMMNGFVAEGLFENTLVSVYPDWYYSYKGLMIPIELQEQTVISEQTEEVVEEDVPAIEGERLPEEDVVTDVILTEQIEQNEDAVLFEDTNSTDVYEIVDETIQEESSENDSIENTNEEQSNTEDISQQLVIQNLENVITKDENNNGILSDDTQNESIEVSEEILNAEEPLPSEDVVVTEIPEEILDENNETFSNNVIEQNLQEENTGKSDIAIEAVIEEVTENAGRFEGLTKEGILAFIRNIAIEDREDFKNSLNSDEIAYLYLQFGVTKTTNEDEKAAKLLELTDLFTETKNIYHIENYDYSILDNIDFSSARLMVATSNENIFVDVEPIIAQLNDVYLLQFTNIETAKEAYAYYLQVADAVEVDNAEMTLDNEAYVENIESVENVNSEEVYRGIDITEEDLTALLDEQETTQEMIDAVDVMTVENNPMTQTQTESVGYNFDIALIDTGANGADESVSFIGEDAADYNGHGTLMLSNIKEQNPNAKVLSLKAFDDSGKAYTSAVYSAVEYAITQKVKIINISASSFKTAETSVLVDIIQEAIANNIIVVASAGNQKMNAKYFIPAGIDGVITIGACDFNGNKCDASNYGDCVDYYVVSQSTSEAASIFSGWVSAHEDVDIYSISVIGLIYLQTTEPDVHSSTVQGWVKDLKDLIASKPSSDVLAQFIRSIPVMPKSCILARLTDKEIDYTFDLLGETLFVDVFHIPNLFMVNLDNPVYEGGADYNTGHYNPSSYGYSTPVGSGEYPTAYSMPYMIIDSSGTRYPAYCVQPKNPSPVTSSDQAAEGWRTIVYYEQFNEAMYRDGAAQGFPMDVDEVRKLFKIWLVGPQGPYYNESPYAGLDGNTVFRQRLSSVRSVFNVSGDSSAIAQEYIDYALTHFMLSGQLSQTGYPTAGLDAYYNDILLPRTEDWGYFTAANISLMKQTINYIDSKIPDDDPRLLAAKGYIGSSTKIKTVGGVDVDATLHIQDLFWIETQPPYETPKNGSVTFYNTVTPTNGLVTFTKTVVSNDAADKNRNFTFSISGGSKTSMTLNGSNNNVGTFTVAPGTTYTITESVPAGWTCSAANNKVTGTMGSMPSKQFSFTWTSTDGQSGNFTITGNGSYTINNLKAGSTVTVTETTPGGNWTQGSTSKTSPAIVAEQTVNGGTFANTYNTPGQSQSMTNTAPGDVHFNKVARNNNGTITIEKVTDPAGRGGNFTFTLTANKTGITYTKQTKSGNSWSNVSGFVNTSISSGGTFTLTDKQRAVITMPAGTQYTVTETNYSGSGWITQTSSDGTTYTEARSVSGTVASANIGSIKYKFKITGLPSGTYSVSGADETSVSNNGYININAGSTATIKDIPVGANVTATETAPAAVSGGTWNAPNGLTVSATVSSGQDKNMGTVTNVFTPSNVNRYFKNIEPGDVYFNKTASVEPTTLKVTKKVTKGPTSDTDGTMKFKFTLKITDASGAVKAGPYSATGGSGYSGTVSGNNGTFYLANNQTITISGIPAGYSYQIEEEVYKSATYNEDMYTTIVTPYNGTASNASDNKKVITGKIATVDLSKKEFTYTITGLDRANISYSVYNNATATGTATSSGTVSNNGTIKLKSGQSARIIDVRADNTVQIVESTTTDTDGTWTYTPTNRTLSKKIVRGSEVNAGTFTNKFKPNGQSVQFENRRNETNATIYKQSSVPDKTKQFIYAQNPKFNQMYSETFRDTRNNNYIGAYFTVRVQDKNTNAIATYTLLKPTVDATAANNYVASFQGATYTGDRKMWVGDKAQVEETKAPLGYLMPAATKLNGNGAMDTNIKPSASGYTVLQKDSTKNTFRFQDEPTFDATAVRLNKGVYENGVLTTYVENSKTKGVAGAVFKVEYFDNTNTSGTPRQTWYYVTDKHGMFMFNNPDYLADNTANWINAKTDGTEYNDTANYNRWRASSAYATSSSVKSGQPFYLNARGIPAFPLGSIKVTEVYAPLGYVATNATLTATITQTGTDNLARFKWNNASLPLKITSSSTDAANGAAAEVGDTQKYGSFSVIKRDVEGIQANNANTVQGDTTFDGIELTVKNISGYDIILKGGRVVKNNEDICTMTFTGGAFTVSTIGAKDLKTGQVYSEDVLPIGTTHGSDYAYEVRETKGNKSYHRNTNWRMKVQMNDDGANILKPTYKVTVTGPVYTTNEGNINLYHTKADNLSLVHDQAIRGGVKFKKDDYDRENTNQTGNDLLLPQGDAILGDGRNGAEITIYNISDYPAVNKDNVSTGTTTPTGKNAIATIKAHGANIDQYVMQRLYTDNKGECSTGYRDLPYGTYIATETKAPTGYHLNKDWYVIFQIREEGLIIDTTSTATSNGSSVTAKTTKSSANSAHSGWYEVGGNYTNKTYAKVEDKIYRGGVSLTKFDEGSLTAGAAEDTLQGAVVGIYNLSEQKVYVKDETGVMSWKPTYKSTYEDLIANNPKEVAEYFRNMYLSRGNDKDKAPLYKMTTDKDGKMTTDTNGDGKDDTLPYGTYIAVELYWPDGYNNNNEWCTVFQIHPNEEANSETILDLTTARTQADKQGEANINCIVDRYAGVSSKYGVALWMDEWNTSGNVMKQTLQNLSPHKQYAINVTGTGSVTITIDGQSSTVNAASANNYVTFVPDHQYAQIEITPKNNVSDVRLSLGNGQAIDQNGTLLDDGTGKLIDTYNTLVLFKHNGTNTHSIADVEFTIWTDDVPRDTVIAHDLDGNPVKNGQVFVTDSNGLIEIKKLLSGENQNGHEYRHGNRIYYIQERDFAHGTYSLPESERVIYNSTITTIMVDEYGFIHQDYEENGNDRISYKEGAEAYAQAIYMESKALEDQTAAAEQLSAAQQILNEAQAAQAQARNGSEDSVKGTANAVASAQKQLQAAQQFQRDADAALATARNNKQAAQSAMNTAKRNDFYSEKEGTSLYTLEVVNVPGTSIHLRTGGAGRTMLYYMGGIALLLALVIYVTKLRKKNLK